MIHSCLWTRNPKKHLILALEVVIKNPLRSKLFFFLQFDTSVLRWTAACLLCAMLLNLVIDLQFYTMIAENSNYVSCRICWGSKSLFCDKRSWQKAEPKEEVLQLVEGCTDIPLPNASLLTSWPSCTWQGSADLLLEMPLTSVPHITYSRMTHSNVHWVEYKILPSTSYIDSHLGLWQRSEQNHESNVPSSNNGPVRAQ